MRASIRPINLILLLILITLWGVNWTMVKLAISEMPPLWLGVSRFAIGAICLFVYVILTKNLRIPTRIDFPVIILVSCLQMALFIALMNVGLMYVDVGRSAILSYTTMLWVTPMAILIFKEPFPFLKRIGLLLGFIGLFLLFNPISFHWSSYNVIFGNILLIIAAMAWAVCILHTRFGRWHLTPLQLLPWQMTIAAIILWFFASILEDTHAIHWSFQLIKLLIYIGPLATALGYWLVIELTRRLPAVTMSVCMLGVPVSGMVIAHFTLGEALNFDKIISILFISMGLICVFLAKSPEKTMDSDKTLTIST